MLTTAPRQDAFFHTLIRHPVRIEELMRISQTWEQPFKSKGALYNFLKRYLEKGAIKKQTINHLCNNGKSPVIYYPGSKAPHYCPELENVSKKSSIFRPYIDNPVSLDHNLGICSFCAEFEASLGELTERIELRGAFRPNFFIATVSIERKNDPPIKSKVVPDYTYIVAIDGKTYLFLVEVQHKVAAVEPSSPHATSAIKTFAHKLKTRREFAKHFRSHRTIQEYQLFYRCKFEGVITLVVTTKRTDTHLHHLISVARKGRKTGEMPFLFARLEDLQGKNVFLEPIWHMTNREKTSIPDSLSLLNR